MGLEIVMIGESRIEAMKKDPSLEPELMMVVRHCLKQYPELGTLDIKEPSELVKGGHKVGNYSDLHLLRGLALAAEKSPATVAELSETDLQIFMEAFYADPNKETQNPHLIYHADDSGFYVPFDLPHPMRIEGVIAGDDEKVTITVGCSAGLLDELNKLNPFLKLAGDLGEMGDVAFANAIEQHKWPNAASVWGVLRLYARESLERNTFIQFC